MDTGSTDNPPDIRRTPADGYDADGVWMSFAELGRARGINRASAARLVRRRKWRKRTDNHGVVQVFVPTGADEPADRQPGRPTEALAGHPADVSRAISALEAAVTTLTAQLERSEQRAQAAEQGRAAAEAQATELRGDLDRLRAQAQAAQDAADALRATDAARRAQGLLARLRAAWRGR